MDKRNFASLAVRVVLAAALSALLPARQALGNEGSAPGAADQGRGKKAGQLGNHPPRWSEGKRQGWKTELPPGWENWGDAKRRLWEHGLKRAKEAVRKHAEARLKAALGALEMAARKGVPLHLAEKMAKAGLERGLGPFDFDPLGRFVVEKVKVGVKGEELSKLILEELNRRQKERQRLHEKMKKNIRQRQDEHRGLREELKEKKELAKHHGKKPVDRKEEKREKSVNKHRRSPPKNAAARARGAKK